MGFYNDVLLPKLCHLAMRNRRLAPYRQRAISLAEGRVLEIGVGSGFESTFLWRFSKRNPGARACSKADRDGAAIDERFGCAGQVH